MLWLGWWGNVSCTGIWSRMPKKTKPKTGNPFYKGASPEDVARALLQKPKDAKAEPEPPKKKPPPL